MKLTYPALAIVLTLTSVLYGGQESSKSKQASSKPGSETQQKGWTVLQKRFTDYSGFMSGQLWALIHTSESEAEMEESLKLFESISITLASDDPSSLSRFEGLAGFKSQLLRLMNSKDDTVSGFAAIVLAITGDMNYAPDIAALLKRKIDGPPDEYPPITVRGRAAVALSILGAKKYTEQIVPLLKSANDYDRSGAAMALDYLKATEHAKDVVDLMLNSDLNVHDDT